MIITKRRIGFSARQGLLCLYAGAILIGSTPFNPAAATTGMMSGMMGRGMMGGSPSAGQDNSVDVDHRSVSEGETLARDFCTRCHVPPDPRQHAAGEWPGVVARMERYMRSRRMPVPDRKQTHEILEYLQKDSHQ